MLILYIQISFHAQCYGSIYCIDPLLFICNILISRICGGECADGSNYSRSLSESVKLLPNWIVNLIPWPFGLSNTRVNTLLSMPPNSKVQHKPIKAIRSRSFHRWFCSLVVLCLDCYHKVQGLIPCQGKTALLIHSKIQGGWPLAWKTWKTQNLKDCQDLRRNSGKFELLNSGKMKNV